MKKRVSLKTEVARLKKQLGVVTRQYGQARDEAAAKWGTAEVGAMTQQLRLGLGLVLHDAAMVKKLQELAEVEGEVASLHADPKFRAGFLDCHRNLTLCEACAEANRPPYTEPGELIAVNAEIAGLDAAREAGDFAPSAPIIPSNGN